MLARKSRVNPQTNILPLTGPFILRLIAPQDCRETAYPDFKVEKRFIFLHLSNEPRTWPLTCYQVGAIVFGAFYRSDRESIAQNIIRITKRWPLYVENLNDYWLLVECAFLSLLSKAARKGAIREKRAFSARAFWCVILASSSTFLSMSW